MDVEGRWRLLYGSVLTPLEEWRPRDDDGGGQPGTLRLTLTPPEGAVVGPLQPVTLPIKAGDCQSLGFFDQEGALLYHHKLYAPMRGDTVDLRVPAGEPSGWLDMTLDWPRSPRRWGRKARRRGR